MKRIVCIIILTLCYTFSMAQSYTHEDSVRAVQEYVARQYLDAWVSAHQQSASTDYENYQACKHFFCCPNEIVIDSTISMSMKNKVLTLLNWGETGAKLYNSVMAVDGDSLYDFEHYDYDAMILRVVTPLFEKSTTDQKTNIRNHIGGAKQQIVDQIKKFRKSQGREEAVINFPVEKALESNDIDDAPAISWISWVMLVGGLVVGFVIGFVVSSKQSKSSRKTSNNNFSEEPKNYGQHNTLTIEQVEYSMNKHYNKLEELIKSQFDKLPKQETHSYQQSLSSPSNVTYSSKHNEDKDEGVQKIYATVESNNTFEICLDKDIALYELTITASGREADFKFVGDVDYALKYKDVAIEIPCRVIRESGNSKISTLKKGKAKYDNGKWYIENRAEVEIV